jgi:hypothetical protein
MYSQFSPMRPPSASADASALPPILRFPPGWALSLANLGQPSSFMIDGRQCVAVQSGWGIDARSRQARFNRLFSGKYPEVPEGGAIWVFATKVRNEK